jgi:hypothetical protein
MRERSIFQMAAGLDQNGDYIDGDEEAKLLVGMSWHERKRYEQLKREWEQWRYRRSKCQRCAKPGSHSIQVDLVKNPDGSVTAKTVGVCNKHFLALADKRDEWMKANDVAPEQLPPEHLHLGPMMKIGQRECRYEYCGRFFEPSDLRQEYCRPAHAKAQERLRLKG